MAAIMAERTKTMTNEFAIESQCTFAGMALSSMLK
jgi:hypothetical protein